MMMTTYRDNAERPEATPPNAAYDAEAARKRGAAKEWLLIGAAFLADLGLTFLAYGAEGFAFAVGMYAVLVVVAVLYDRFQKRVERRSFFRQKLARETEELLRAVEDEKMRTRVFLRPMPAATTGSAEPLEASDDEAPASDRALLRM